MATDGAGGEGKGFRSPPSSQGNYGNRIDGTAKLSLKKKKEGGDGKQEDSELLQRSSEDEADDDGELASVSSTQPVKPLITDRQVCQAGQWDGVLLKVGGGR